ncbi:excinuclease ABC subunit UvrA [Aeoliella mucimassa]|uniref:UvrABC system protein A n=1 Tax=Aeoliella mucimassa TaxID=2527972 RepID=A0A518AUL6_9BACT|nr:excinuclease ABC subunit UvrA [Aeoliella mucimassa]QDU58418.1 UvrABC system protein A [Aeoliella mucimassa]
MNGHIRIRGARTHNLANIDVDIPRNQLVVITGVSGSGKSSLAFDTLLAEGQRQYIDSLSVYTRQFFDQLERPDVDSIEGLQPAVAVDQSVGSHNARSTVGTVTEVYDHLRVLFSRAGTLACAECGTVIEQQSPAEIEESIGAMPMDARVMIVAPLVRGRKGKHSEVLDSARKAGFARVRIDGVTYPIDEVPELGARKIHDISAVVDRIVIREGIENRLAESVRLALKHGDGVLEIVYQIRENGEKSDVWKERVFSTHFACHRCGTSVAEVEPRTFSFNSPYGACAECGGLGVNEGFDPEMVLPDLTMSLSGGAIAPWRGDSKTRQQKHRKLLEAFDWDQPLESWSEEKRQKLLTGDGKKFHGLLLELEIEWAGTKSDKRRAHLSEFRGEVVCADCNGSRLGPAARTSRVGGLAIEELTSLTIAATRKFFETVEFDVERQPIATPLVREIQHRLKFLEKAGVGYLTLARRADTLSGGELQRVRLASAIGSGLVGVMYLLDEPSIGLHPRDNGRLIETLRELQQQGNSVIVVEHEEAFMREADYLVDCGPGAGRAGGHIVATGTPTEVAECEKSLTGRYLSNNQSTEIRTPRKALKTKRLVLEGATLHNLKDATLDIPLGLFTCVTGVSGSGKSSLVIETLARQLARQLHGAVAKPGPFRSLRGTAALDRAVLVDQSPIGRTPRSNAATYTGIFDDIRKIFAGTKLARQRGWKTGRFSFNVQGGRCEECQGQGLKKVEMNFLPDLFIECPVCHGARFNRETLRVTYRDKSIADVLALSIGEAVEFFTNFASVKRILQALVDVGLDYLPLGQPSTTLSGGEAQRIKLATELGRPTSGHTLYILDEPTTGLHPYNVEQLLSVLHQLVDAGNTVVVIEHQTSVMRSADWIIDLGPDGGSDGGQVIYTGPAAEIADCEESHTGRWLRNHL